MICADCGNGSPQRRTAYDHHTLPLLHDQRQMVVGSEQPISRILFLSRLTAATDDNHLSWAAVARRLQRPTRRWHGRATRRRDQQADRAIPPVWPCSRWGLPQPASHLAAGELLPRHFTLTRCRAVCFCGTVPGVAPAGRYPASRSVEFGLSSGDCKPPAIVLLAQAHLLIYHSGAYVVKRWMASGKARESIPVFRPSFPIRYAPQQMPAPRAPRLLYHRAPGCHQ